MSDPRRITVTGMGRAAVPADAVVVRLGVEVTATTPGEALAACADAERQMVAAATEAGVARAGVTTRWATVEPRWEQYGNRPQLRGYVARLDVEAIVEELSSAGAVAAAALSAGGDVARLHALAPVVRDRAPGEATARELAYADARARAEHYASLAGQRLDRLLVLDEAGHEMGHHPRFGLMAAAGARAESLEVHAGEHEIAVAVSATWELAD
ncbi:MAG: SIMPL domain-containing protein [Frankiaceae bacterium]